MSNENALKNLKNYYESLQYFSIQNNMLILNSNQTTYVMPLTHINLASLNPSLFLLSPIQIYHVLYMLELLYKENITDVDINFIKSYVNNYLKINKEYLDGNSEYEFLSSMLGIPINLSYDNSFSNSETGVVIQNLMTSYNNDLEGGKSTGKKLVLSNGITFAQEEDNRIDIYEKYTKAGFATFLLIASTIVATCIYIIFFIYNK